MSKYAVTIEDAGPNLCAYVPDLPGCVSAGYSVEEVTANINEAIELHIASMIEHGEDVPPPSSQVVLAKSLPNSLVLLSTSGRQMCTDFP